MLILNIFLRIKKHKYKKLKNIISYIYIYKYIVNLYLHNIIYIYIYYEECGQINGIMNLTKRHQVIMS